MFLEEPETKIAAQGKSLFKLDFPSAICITVLSIPLSVKIFLPLIHTEIIYPAETLIGFVILWFLYKIIFDKKKSLFSERNFIRHPLTIIVFAYIGANIISAIFSTLPFVSFKAVLVKSCYIFVFYFIMHSLIRSSMRAIFEMFKLYGFSLLFVILYTLGNWFLSDLNLNGVNYLSNPFYSDHTIYAAALAFVTPVLFAAFFYSDILEMKPSEKKIFLFMTILVIAELYFSFSRAAWISILCCVLLLLLLKAGLRFYAIVGLTLSILAAAILNVANLKEIFMKNKVDSNIENAGLYEKFFSITNITNDLSNAERLNRWSCALRMFRDRPLFGFGPGTYQFQYLSYQRQNEMTGISVTVPLEPGSTSYKWSPGSGLISPSGAAVQQGGGGTTHSEYLLALSESGIFSALTFMAFLLVSLYVSLKIFTKSHSQKIRIISICMLLGLVSYFTHALFNNFLDDCKLAFLFWFSLSVLATIDSSTNWKKIG